MDGAKENQGIPKLGQLGQEGLTRLDREIHAWIDSNSDKLLELSAALVRFDTQSVEPAFNPKARNQEGECQAFLRDRLRGEGADVEAVKPNPGDFNGHPMMPPGHHWEGRDMTLARFRGVGGGRSLILNGHIDVVSVEPRGSWSRDPFLGIVEDGRLYGRGSCDMKGGLAAAIIAVEAIRALQIPLQGDIWIHAVTDEETNGMGTVAMTRIAPPADAAVIPEPSGFQAVIACRGILYGRVEIEGRAAHAELSPPPWQEEGGVGAISKLRYVLKAIDELNELWSQQQEKIHPLLAKPWMIPTLVEGGEFIATYPARCHLSIDATYLPADADATGFGSMVRAEIERFIQDFCSSDNWLRKHPPRFEWLMDYPPYEARGLEDLLGTVDAACSLLDIDVPRIGNDSWNDSVSLGLFAGIPAMAFGPGDRQHRRGHTIDEWIATESLLNASKAFASIIARWCGLSQLPGLDMKASAQ